MGPEPVSVHLASIGLIRDGSRVLLVESRYPNVADPFWALPGGLIEAGESITDALVREVKEETDIDVMGSVSVTAVIWLLTAEGLPHWVTFLCEPERWRGEPAHENDPDGVTTGAAFVLVDDAIERLAALPWGLSDPIVERLRGARPGGVWVYRWPGAGPWDGNGPAHLVRGPETAPVTERGL